MRRRLWAIATRYQDGWRILRRGAGRARRIGRRPVRDHARLFNAASLWLLAIVLCLALLDAPLSRIARESDPDLRALFRFFTDLAKSDWMLVASGVLGLGLIPIAARGQRRRKAIVAAWIGLCAFAFAAIAGSGIAVNLLKIVFGRGRPKTMATEGPFVAFPFTIDPTYASFPSGHATTAFALAAVLALLMPRARTGFLAFAAALSISRVVVGAHYPSDVLAGGLLGLGFTYVLASAFHHRGLVFAVRHGQWTLKAPRTLLRPLRRMTYREPIS